MEIHELECFKAVVEEGSILKASIKLHMTQPPLSRMMKQLEENLDTKLFIRGKRITLTETGRLLYERASSIISLKDDTLKEIVSLEKKNEITLQLGIVSSSTNLLYDQSISNFHSNNPKIKFNIKEGNTFQLVEMLKHKIIDLAIIRTPYDFEEFDSMFFEKEKMVALSINNTLSPIIKIDDLSGKDIIIYRRFKQKLSDIFKTKNLDFNIIAEVDDAKTAILLASTGLGIAIVPASASKTFKHLNLIEAIIEEPQLVTRLGVIYRKNEPLNNIYKELIACLNRIKD